MRKPPLKEVWAPGAILTFRILHSSEVKADKTPRKRFGLVPVEARDLSAQTPHQQQIQRHERQCPSVVLPARTLLIRELGEVEIVEDPYLPPVVPHQVPEADVPVVYSLLPQTEMACIAYLSEARPRRPIILTEKALQVCGEHVLLFQLLDWQ